MPAVSAQLSDFIPAAPRAAAAPASGPSWLSRLAHAFAEARTRQAEREIARYIQTHGGRLTDDVERRIEHYFI